MNVWLLIVMVIILLVTVYLAVIIFAPVLKVKDQLSGRRIVRREAPACRQDITIDAAGTYISAWLYLPGNISKPVPCVVLSTGFAGTKDAILEPYALKFVENGIAAITYDYRYFGSSGGEPRQLCNGKLQQNDLRTVIDFARKRSEIDGDRIILWSISAAGSYGIIVASTDNRIAGVITQCPSLDHARDDKLIFQREGVGFFFRLFMHAQRDKGRSRFRLSPHNIPAVGKPHTLALMTAPGALEGYERLIATSEHFVNGICARSLLMLQGPDVIKVAPGVKCPVLIIVAENDNTVAPDTYVRVASILGEKAEVIKYPAGHFDLYEGQMFEKSVTAQLDFVKRVASIPA